MSFLIEKHPRLHDDGYLAWLRLQPCACGCRQPPPCDAAHVRATSLQYGKAYTPKGRKPDDKWALPLKHLHHMAQTNHGDELGWWAKHGVADVFALCIKYYAAYGGDGGHPRKKRATARARPPKEKRQRIPSRPWPKQQRKLRSRKP